MSEKAAFKQNKLSIEISVSRVINDERTVANVSIQNNRKPEPPNMSSFTAQIENTDSHENMQSFLINYIYIIYIHNAF